MSDVTMSVTGSATGSITGSPIWRALPHGRSFGHGLRGSAPDAAALAGVILLWGVSPVLAVRALTLPPFLFLAIAFAAGFLVFAARGWLRGGPIVDLSVAARSGAAARQVFGAVGAGACGVLALRLIHPVEGAALSDVWPVVGAATGALTGLSAGDLASGAGGALLAAALALCGLLCWSAATARRRRAGAAHAGLGTLYGLAALLSFFLHLCLEPRLVHDGMTVLAAIAIGLGPLGVAQLLRRRLED